MARLTHEAKRVARGPKTSLEESTDRYTRHNNEMTAKLAGQSSAAFTRVINSPEVPLDDATERARKHWDAMEAKLARRSSVPPRAK